MRHCVQRYYYISFVDTFVMASLLASVLTIPLAYGTFGHGRAGNAAAAVAGLPTGHICSRVSPALSLIGRFAYGTSDDVSHRNALLRIFMRRLFVSHGGDIAADCQRGGAR